MSVAAVPPSPHVQAEQLSPGRQQLIHLLRLQEEHRRLAVQDEQTQAEDGLLLVLSLAAAVFLFFLLAITFASPSPPPSSRSLPSSALSPAAHPAWMLSGAIIQTDEQLFTQAQRRRLTRELERVNAALLLQAADAWDAEAPDAALSHNYFVDLKPLTGSTSGTGGSFSSSSSRPPSSSLYFFDHGSSEQQSAGGGSAVDAEGFAGQDTAAADSGECSVVVLHPRCGRADNCSGRGRCQQQPDSEFCRGSLLHRTLWSQQRQHSSS